MTNKVRRFATATAVAMALALSLHATAQSTETTQIDLPAQPLAQAIQAVARQASINILVDPRLVEGREAPAVKAEMSIQQALNLLLHGTGLTPRYVDDKTITLVAVTAAVPSKTSANQTSRNIHLAQNTESTETNNSSSASSSDDADDKSVKLQEIVVTAQKQKERLQDVPMSVTAITGKQLKERGAVDIKDVLGSVPGLSYSGVERGQSAYTIRGISNTVKQPTTGIYLDDMALVTGTAKGGGALDPVLFDIERVEVLKGPQGTLYGGSAMGGAIKYVSARPNLDAFSSEVAAGLSSIQDGEMSYNGEGVLNMPLIPGVLAVRAGAAYLYEGGYIDNVANLDIERTNHSSTPYPTYTPELIDSLGTVSEEDYNSAKTTVGRVSLLWSPDPSWSIRPAFQYQSSTSENPPFFLTNHSGLVSSHRFDSQPTDDRSRIFSLDVNKTWGGVEVTSLTGYFLRDGGWSRDYSFIIGDLFPFLYPYNTLNPAPLDRKAFTQELRIASAADSQGRLRWVGGLYYSTQSDKIDDTIWTYGAPQIPDDLLLRSQSETDLDQYAAFGELTYQITSALDVTVGARFFKLEEDFSGYTLNGFFVGGQTIVTDALQSEEDGINPKIGVTYRLDDRHMVYASAAKGFRPGEPLSNIVYPSSCEPELAQIGLARPPNQLNSDELWTYELGSKNEFVGGNAVINGAIFYTDWKEIPQTIQLPLCGLGFLANAGAAEVKGAEIEARFAITPALTVGASAAYTDAEIVEATYAVGVTPGDPVLDTPQWTASAYSVYSLNLTDAWDLDVRLDYQYRGRQRRQFATTQGVTFPGGETGVVPYAALYQEDYDSANAVLMLKKGMTNIRLFVNNVTNERPELDGTSTFGYSRSATLRPRTVGLEVRQQF